MGPIKGGVSHWRQTVLVMFGEDPFVLAGKRGYFVDRKKKKIIEALNGGKNKAKRRTWILAESGANCRARKCTQKS